MIKEDEMLFVKDTLTVLHFLFFPEKTDIIIFVVFLTVLMDKNTNEWLNLIYGGTGSVL